MIPSDIDGAYANFPRTNDFSIVIITGGDIRHRRFALRLIEEFGDLVSAWFQCDQSVAKVYAAPARGVAPLKSLKSRLLEFAREGIPYARGNSRASQFVAAIRVLLFRYRWRKHLDSYRFAEEAMFGDEVTRLESNLQYVPQKINPDDINTPEFAKRLEILNPYFLLTLAGPLYSSELLRIPRGVSINQHAGHSPVLKGSNTVEWALYRHQLEYVSSTVHITTTGADAGPILRRSNPCLAPDEDSASVFCRVVALGTELMIEVVRDIIDGKPVRTYPQPSSTGTTYLGRDVRPHILHALQRDNHARWLRDELVRLRNW